jgi:hypothetical protein
MMSDNFCEQFEDDTFSSDEEAFEYLYSNDEFSERLDTKTLMSHVTGTFASATPQIAGSFASMTSPGTFAIGSLFLFQQKIRYRWLPMRKYTSKLGNNDL